MQRPLQGSVYLQDISAEVDILRQANGGDTYPLIAAHTIAGRESSE
jgi:hypothetical protein